VKVLTNRAAANLSECFTRNARLPLFRISCSNTSPRENKPNRMLCLSCLRICSTLCQARLGMHPRRMLEEGVPLTSNLGNVIVSRSYSCRLAPPIVEYPLYALETPRGRLKTKESCFEKLPLLFASTTPPPGNPPISPLGCPLRYSPPSQCYRSPAMWLSRNPLRFSKVLPLCSSRGSPKDVPEPHGPSLYLLRTMPRSPEKWTPSASPSSGGRGRHPGCHPSRPPGRPLSCLS